MSKDDILVQIPLTERKLSDLILLCEKCDKSGPVSMEIRDSVEDLLTKERSTLDKIIHEYFVKNTTLSSNIKTFFPFCHSPSELDTCYEKIEIPSLRQFNPRLFSLLEKFQQYQSDFNWLHDLQEYSNLRHKEVITVVKHNSVEGIQTAGINIISPNMNLSYVKIGNILIRKLKTVNGEVVSGDIDEELKTILNIRYHFYVKKTNTDIVLLCKQGLEVIKLIIQDFL